MSSLLSPATIARTKSPFRSTRTSDGERKEKREALLLAAVRMFNERGFHATALEDVAASLGVTKPVIYHHLGNKDQVLFECVRIGVEALKVAAAVSSAEAGSGLDRLKAFLRRYGEIILDDFGRCVARSDDAALSPDTRAQFRASKREIDQALRAMIEAAVADGSAVVPDVRVAAFAFAGALNWSARWYRHDGASDPAQMAADMVDLLCGGIEFRPA